MSKEIISIPELRSRGQAEELDGFRYITETRTKFDGEKGSSEIEFIIQRISDNKYFRFYGVDWGRGIFENDSQATEVNRIEKLVYVYI